jgi:hypothetical protein
MAAVLLMVVIVVVIGTLFGIVLVDDAMADRRERRQKILDAQLKGALPPGQTEALIKWAERSAVLTKQVLRDDDDIPSLTRERREELERLLEDYGDK